MPDEEMNIWIGSIVAIAMCTAGIQPCAYLGSKGRSARVELLEMRQIRCASEVGMIESTLIWNTVGDRSEMFHGDSPVPKDDADAIANHRSPDQSGHGNSCALYFVLQLCTIIS